MVVDVIETHTNHCWGFDDHSNDHSNAASKLMNVRRKVSGGTVSIEAMNFWVDAE